MAVDGQPEGSVTSREVRVMFWSSAKQLVVCPEIGLDCNYYHHDQAREASLRWEGRFGIRRPTKMKYGMHRDHSQLVFLNDC